MARPRAAGHEAQREAILAQAARLFATQGYPSTTMAQVAQACGLSKAALYHYVRDKHQLLHEIALGQMEALHALVDTLRAELGPQPEPRLLLRLLIERLVVAYAGARDAHRVLADELRYLGPAEREQLLQRQRELVAVLADALARWQPQQARAGLAKPLTMLLFGMVNWLCTWMRPDGALDHRALAPIVAELFLRGVPCVAAPPSPSPQALPAPQARPATPATGSVDEPVLRPSLT